MIHCSAQRERCWAIMAQAIDEVAGDVARCGVLDAVRSADDPIARSSRSLIRQALSDRIGSIGSEVPAIAPLPKGIECRHAVDQHRRVGSTSRANIVAHASASAPATIGWAR